MTTFGLAFASIRHRRLRTALTVFSVAITLAMLSLTISASARVNAIIDGFDQPRLNILQLDDGGMPVSHLAKLKSIPLLSAIESVRGEQGSDVQQRFHFEVWGASPGWLDHVPSAVVAPRPGVLERWRTDRQGFIVTPRVLEEMKWKEGDLVTFNASFGPVQGHVVGLADGDSDTLFMHFEQLDQSAKDHDFVTLISVGCERANFTECAKAIESTLAAAGTPVLALPQRTAIAFFLQSMGTIPRLMRLIGTLMALLTFVVTTTSLATSLRERRVDFGVLRALGYRRGRITALIVTESVTVSLLGGLVGAGLPYLLYHHDGVVLGAGLLQNVTVSASTFGLELVGAVVLGLVVAIIPAFSASRVDVVHALGDG